ncbi:MAG: hypothetical protein R3F53_27775 [Gammaproteobacteria bacterium]
MRFPNHHRQRRHLPCLQDTQGLGYLFGVVQGNDRDILAGLSDLAPHAGDIRQRAAEMQQNGINRFDSNNITDVLYLV